MKVIIAGSTGTVGTALVKQAINNLDITEVVALGRREVILSDDTKGDKSKLVNAVLEDFGNWTDDAREKVKGAGAAVWTLAVTPSKAREMDAKDVKRICQDYTLIGLEEIVRARGRKGEEEGVKGATAAPFRFMYISGIAARRERNDIPEWVPEEMMGYMHMRIDTVNDVFDFTEKHKEERIEVSIARPGLITYPGMKRGPLPPQLKGVEVSAEELAACFLEQVLNGFESDDLDNDDLVRLGRKALGEQ